MRRRLAMASLKLCRQQQLETSTRRSRRSRKLASIRPLGEHHAPYCGFAGAECGDVVGELPLEKRRGVRPRDPREPTTRTDRKRPRRRARQRARRLERRTRLRRRGRSLRHARRGNRTRMDSSEASACTFGAGAAGGPHDRAGAALAEADKSVLKSNVSLDWQLSSPGRRRKRGVRRGVKIQAIRRSAPSGCLSCQAHGPSRGSRLNPDKECSNVGHDASNAGSRRPFRPPDPLLESEDGRVHLRPAQQDPHRQPRKDDARCTRRR